MTSFKTLPAITSRKVLDTQFCAEVVRFLFQEESIYGNDLVEVLFDPSEH